MKCVKKLVAVLLIAVMALTLLTACGGGGSSAETGNQLTAKSIISWRMIILILD